MIVPVKVEPAGDDVTEVKDDDATVPAKVAPEGDDVTAVMEKDEAAASPVTAN